MCLNNAFNAIDFEINIFDIFIGTNANLKALT